MPLVFVLIKTCTLSTFIYLKLQMIVDVDDEITKITQNEPYIPVVRSDRSSQYYVVAGRKIAIKSCSFNDALIDLVSMYFVFDIAYPKPMYPLPYFIQRFILDIKDNQAVTPAVTRMLNCLRI